MALSLNFVRVLFLYWEKSIFLESMSVVGYSKPDVFSSKTLLWIRVL